VSHSIKRPVCAGNSFKQNQQMHNNMNKKSLFSLLDKKAKPATVPCSYSSVANFCLKTFYPFFMVS
jgi:hypothetical protein